ncbi:hypothetical protein [Halomonas sp. I5-271120]|uniref:hypothetical protein n=1 Tax=Halomonas sp. I5-271120 TaxID=3061632 RepID=UPI002714DE75|nr:hypothetical protein [Halomonas sp. I5-271120]
MTKDTVIVARGGFHYFAEHLCCEVGDLPHLDLAQPVNGTPNVNLSIKPVLLKKADGQRELLNAESVSHALQKLPGVGSVMVHEVDEDDLSPIADLFLKFIYRIIKPCYELPTKKQKTAARRQNALNILKGDPLLQQFITEVVFPGKDPLQRSTIFKLFDAKLSINAIDMDLKVFRDNQQKTGEHTSTRSNASPAKKPKPALATESMQAEVSGPAAPIASDIPATRLAVDGCSAPASAQLAPTSQDDQPHHRQSLALVSEDAQPDSDAAHHPYSSVDDRVEADTVPEHMPPPSPKVSAPPQAPLENNATSTPSHPAPPATHQPAKAKPTFPHNLSQITDPEHALRMAEFDFGVSPRTRHVGRTPQTVIREKLGLNID